METYAQAQRSARGDWGIIGRHDHVCLFYSTVAEELASTVPYIARGLAQGQQCLYLAADATVEAICQALAASGIAVDAAQRSNALAIMPAASFFLPGGHFQPAASVQQIVEAAAAGLAAGFTGLRVTGAVPLAGFAAPDYQPLFDYEAGLIGACRDYAITALCRYPLEGLPAAVVHDLLRLHTHVVYAGTLCSNPYYTPPAQTNGPDEEAREVQRLLDGLLVFERAQVGARTNRDRFRRFAETAQEVIFRYRLWPTPGFEYINPAATAVTGYTPEEQRANPDMLRTLVHPDDWPVVEQLLQGQMSEARPASLRLVRKDRRVSWVEQSAVPIYDDQGRLVAVEGVLHDVTERTVAEQALRDSEARYRGLVEASLEAIYLYDAETLQVLEANPAFLRLLGYTAQEARGLTVYDIVANDAASVTAFWKIIMSDGKADMGERLWRRKDGQCVPVHVTASRFSQGGCDLIAVVGRDVSDRQRMQAQLQQSEARLRLMVEQMPAILWTTNTDLRITYITGAGMAAFGREAKDILGTELLDHFPGRHQSQSPMAEHLRALRGESVSYRVTTQGTVHDAHVEPLRDAAGNIVGCIGVALDVTERERAELERLRQAQIIDQIHDSVITTDLDGFITRWNKGAERLAGYTAQEALGRHILFLYFEEDAALLQEQVVTPLRQRGFHEVELRLRHKSGEPYYVHLALSLLRDEAGSPTGMIGYAIDISARKHAEAELQRMAAIVEHANEAILSTDLDGRVTSWNPAAERIYGYRADEMIGQPIARLLPADRQHESDHILQRVARGERVEHHETVRQSKDGQLIDVLLTVSPVRDSAGKLAGASSIAHDITRRKAAEQEVLRLNHTLRQRVAELQTVLDMLPVGICVARDAAGQDMTINPAGARMLGIEAGLNPSKTGPSSEQLPFRVLQNGQEVPNDELPMQKAAAQDIVLRDVYYDVLHADGRVVNLLEYASPVHDEHGQVQGCIGVFVDVTELRQAEAERARAAALIAALSQVAARLQHSLDPEQIIPTLGAELERLGLTAVVLLPEARGAHPPAFVVRYISCDPETLARIDQLTGRSTLGFRVRLDQLPLRTPLLEERRPVFIDDIVPLMARLVPKQPLTVTQTTFEWAGVRKDTPVVAVPLVAGNQMLGLLVLWGQALREDDLPALSVFGGQVAAALENGRLFEAEREQRSLAETLRDTAEALSRTLDFEEVLDLILANASRIVPHDAADIALIEPTRHFRMVRSRGYDQFGIRRMVDQLRFSLDDFAIFRQVSESRGPIVIPDTAECAEWVHLPKLTWIRSFLSAPIRMKGGVWGFISLISQQPGFFTEVHAERIQALAGQAAVALENAHLFEQVRAGRQRLQALSRRLLDVQEAERRSIARELHDEISQALTGLKLLLELNARSPEPAVHTRLAKAQSLVDDLMDRVRDLSLDLRPTMLDDLGLLPAYLWQFERYTAQTGVRVHFQHMGLDRRFAPDVETAAYRIVQEALTNTARYARVEAVSVMVWADQDTLNIQVEDRGAGFDTQRAFSNYASSGLTGMRERATLIGGQLTIESAPGAGTQVTAELPLDGLPGHLDRRRGS